jgi:hypothetical protein
MFKIPIIPASGISLIVVRRWTSNLLRTGCIDYSSVRYKSICHQEILQTTLCRSGYADYSSVRCKAICVKPLGEFDCVPIIPASGRSSIAVRRYGHTAVFRPARVCALSATKSWWSPGISLTVQGRVFISPAAPTRTRLHNSPNHPTSFSLKPWPSLSWRSWPLFARPWPPWPGSTWSRC